MVPSRFRLSSPATAADPNQKTPRPMATQTNSPLNIQEGEEHPPASPTLTGASMSPASAKYGDASGPITALKLIRQQ